MGLFSKPEVVIAKESSNAKEYLRQLGELAEKATGDFLFCVYLALPISVAFSTSISLPVFTS